MKLNFVRNALKYLTKLLGIYFKKNQNQNQSGDQVCIRLATNNELTSIQVQIKKL